MRISTFEHGTNNLAMQLAISIVAHILELDYTLRGLVSRAILTLTKQLKYVYS